MFLEEITTVLIFFNLRLPKRREGSDSDVRVSGLMRRKTTVSHCFSNSEAKMVLKHSGLPPLVCVKITSELCGSVDVFIDRPVRLKDKI